MNRGGEPAKIALGLLKLTVPLYDTSPTMIPLRRIDSEIIHFGRTNHQPDNALLPAQSLRATPKCAYELRKSGQTSATIRQLQDLRHQLLEPPRQLRPRTTKTGKTKTVTPAA